jgi:DNA replication protein DnaC
LQQIDGRTDSERSMHFHRLLLHEGNREAVVTVERAISVRRGMVTLNGPLGTGKTTLVTCAVNATREANVPSVYTTMSDLLAYLRSAFDPQHEHSVTCDARWELLLSAEVLAIDELDEFSATPWAMERFMRLIDERWRRMDNRLTLLATNATMQSLPPKIASRLRDGRASVVALAGRDMRPLREWEGI